MYEKEDNFANAKNNISGIKSVPSYVISSYLILFNFSINIVNDIDAKMN